MNNKERRMMSFQKHKILKTIVFLGFVAISIVAINHVVYADKSDPMPLTPPSSSDVVFEDNVQIETDIETIEVPSQPDPEKEIEEKSFRSAKDEFKKKYSQDNYEQDLVIRTQDGQDHYFSVELALTSEEQSQGLMFRKSMPEMHGMLFVFPSSQPRGFWMKDTLIPLDMIFIEKDGRISHIHSNAQPLDKTVITSGGDAKAVLELNGGMSDKLGLQAGDKILHTAFKNRHME